MTMRMIPPPAGSGVNPITVNGRTYTGVPGASIDVPDHDGLRMEGNGWTVAAPGGAGATAARPTTGLYRGLQFHDATLGINVVWDGKAWRNPTSGAAA